MATNREAILTSGAIPTTLFRLAGPMSVGLFAQISFTLADTLFVARLGTDALAALGFAFPVVFVISNITMGLGTATSAVVSQAIGRGDQHLVRRYTTDSLILSLVIVVALSAGGYVTVKPLFAALGARGETLHLVRQYMAITYLGIAFMVIPTISINAIRATGDTVTPSAIMVVAALVNVVLDPIMIYGLFGFPRLEVAGAALASAIMAFPLMVRPIRLAIEAIDIEVDEVARTFGAGRLTRFLRLTVPLATPGLIAGAMLGFAKALGEFGATITFVGAIPGQTLTLPTAIYQAVQAPGGEARAIALCAVSAILAFGAVLIADTVGRWAAKRARG